RKKYSVTTCSRHWMRKYPNLIRGFDLERPHRLWVGDITYISLKGGFAYLALITDAYSKRIVGYDLNTTLERDGALRALRMAIDQTPQQKRQGLIHHSDRGCQYCSKEYVKLLTDNGIRISMTEKGDPYENAVAERVNGILKSEWIDEECFESFQAAKERIDQIVILYNSLRPHASCDWLTPLEAELRTGKLKHHWGRKTVVRKAYVNLYQDNIF
ncbi:IS3 family transposase, partial [Alistipes shahii]